MRDGLHTGELVEAATLLQRGEGIDAVEISVGHYESGFPMVCGTFDQCLRNMLKGSMSYPPPLRRTFAASVQAVGHAGLESVLERALWL
ncbi:hypothetical protein [Propionivibrio sp.]|uniref:hypothetical protein n=1 Tax=Propionivibrio sp. TaxID=2212460 RepID=UPI0025D56D80|nr:hypothetical protein [Propionivibrio sp.]MBK7357157.1 hypothetical protein [Propionivibrio sp.]